MTGASGAVAAAPTSDRLPTSHPLCEATSVAVDPINSGRKRGFLARPRFSKCEVRGMSPFLKMRATSVLQECWDIHSKGIAALVS